MGFGRLRYSMGKGSNLFRVVPAAMENMCERKSIPIVHWQHQGIVWASTVSQISRPLHETLLNPSHPTEHLKVLVLQKPHATD